MQRNNFLWTANDLKTRVMNFFYSCLKPFRVERVKDIQKNKKPTKNYNGHMFVTFKKIFVEVFTQEKDIDIINVTIKKC